MEVEYNCYIPRKFGYARILWEIDNCFCTTYKKHWIINSPDFIVNGSVFTKWKLMIRAFRVENDEYSAAVYLERLPFEEHHGKVQVFLNMWYMLGLEKISLCERQIVFTTESGHMVSHIKKFQKLEERFQLISSDRLCIEGLILVHSTDDSTVFEVPKDIGLKNFSQDIGILFGYTDCYDLKIKVGSKSFSCHKSVLSTRNNYLDDIIEKNIGKTEIRLRWSDEKSAEQIFRYLYSGNLKYVIRSPSIAVDEAINNFGIKELEEYYLKDELTLSTHFEVREFYFKWIIPDIETKTEEYLFSPQFSEMSLNMKFRMCLGMNQSMINGSLSVFLEPLSPLQFPELYIIFGVSDINDLPSNLKRMRWSKEDNLNIGIQDFIPKEKLVVGYLNDGTLCIFCRIFIPVDSTRLSVISSRECLLTNRNFEEYFALASERIGSLYESAKYSDIVIQTGDEMFNVHKCILTARSPVFKRTVKLLRHPRGFSVKDVEPNIMRIVLSYVYTGILKDYELCDLPKIYFAAQKFGMLILRYQCALLLQNDIQTSNVLGILFQAHRYNDSKLKIACFNFIVHHIRELRQQDKWDSLKSKTRLFRELANYASGLKQNNPELVLELKDV